MAYEVPALGTAGQVYTAAAHNIIVEDILNHESRFKLHGVVTETNIFSSTATTFAAASNIFSSSVSVVADGSTTYIVEFYASLMYINTAGQLSVRLSVGGVESGILVLAALGAAQGVPTMARVAWTPSAATHSVNARLVVTTGTGILFAGTAGVADYFPMALRIYGNS